MKKSEEFKDYIVFDLLGDFSGIFARAMFSGYGIYPVREYPAACRGVHFSYTSTGLMPYVSSLTGFTKTVKFLPLSRRADCISRRMKKRRIFSERGEVGGSLTRKKMGRNSL